MPLPSVIGLYSPAPQCGKSTVANYLWARHHYVRVPFAGTLKKMIRAMLDDCNIDPNRIEKMEKGDKTEIFHPLFPGVTMRKLYQTLGTEWGRQLIDQELWVKIWNLKVSGYLQCGQNVVIEDVRFMNEFNMIDSLGGTMWGIARTEAVEKHKSDHASEKANMNVGYFDHFFRNDGTIDELLDEVEMTLSIERNKP